MSVERNLRRTSRRLTAGGSALMLGATFLLAGGPAAAALPGWSTGVQSWVTDLNTGQRLSAEPEIRWRRGDTRRATIVVDPSRRYQTMTGFGASMTDSSAYVLSRLPVKARKKIMTQLFSPTDGIGLSISSTPITAPFWISGTTSTDREAESQAIWPGKASTSSTRKV